MKKVRSIVLFFAAVMLMTSCIYDQVMSQMQSDNASGTNTVNNGGTYNGGSVNSDRITSLQMAINDENIKDGDVIDLSDSKYVSITDYKATINKAVTIKNGGFRNDAVTVATDGVVLSNIHRANVSTSNSLRISGSSLNSLSITSDSPTHSANQIVGRGETSSSKKPPVVEVTGTEVAEDVSVNITNAYLTVENFKAKKNISLDKPNVQLTIKDKGSYSDIAKIKTNTVCQVVLEKGIGDNTTDKIEVSGEGELKQINMDASNDMKLLKLTPTSGLTPYVQQGSSIDFSNVTVLGTYQADNGVTLFRAGGLSENLSETFSKLEKDFIVSIDGEEVYKAGKNVTTYDWTTLTAAEHQAKITSNWANKEEDYAYQFNILVIGASSSAEQSGQGGQGGSETQTEFVMPTFVLDVDTVDFNDERLKKIYYEGEPLNMTGLVVTGTYKSTVGNLAYTSVISDYTLSLPNGTILNPSEHNSVTITVNGENNATATKTIVLAIYQRVKVTFLANEGDTESYAVRRILKDATVDQMNDPVRAGYTFNGWYNGNTRFIVGTTIVTEDITLTADWTPKTITYSFDANGGKWDNNDTSRDVTGNYGANVVKPADPTKVGSTFDGWNPAVPETFGETNISFTAKWITHGSHTITYNNTKGLTNPNVTSFIETESVTLYGLTTDGYSFGGWSLTPNGGAPVTGWSAGDQTGDVTLYAKWTTHKYTIHFDANGGDGTMDNLTVYYDETADLTNCSFTAPTGLKFGSWNTKADGTGISYDDGASVKNLAKTDGTIVTLYAQWIDKDAHSITYNNTKNAVNTNRTSFLESDTITLSGITAVGYTFDGWYDASADGNLVNGWSAGAKTDNVTLWARWNALQVNYTVKHYQQPTNGSTTLSEYVLSDTQTLSGTTDTQTAADEKTYVGFTAQPIEQQTIAGNGSTVVNIYYNRNNITYTFDAAGGKWSDNSTTNQTVSGLYGATVNAPVNPTRLGYTFSEYDSGMPSIFDSEDLEFVAQWNCVDYIITYNLNDGTNSESNPSVYCIESPTFTLAAPTKAGFTFGGWYSDNEFTNRITTIELGSTGDITLWAKWNINGYTVSFDVDGGSSVSSQDINYNSTATRPSAPTKTGYTFDDWYSDSGKTIKFDFSTPITANTTLYAKWTLDNYTITYNLDGGTNNSSNPSSYNVTSSTISLANPTKTGYTFGGWYTSSNFSGSAVTSIATGSTGNKTFYAKWNIINYTITYNLDGGTNNSSNPSSYNVTSSTISLANPTKTGYTFGGWYTSSNFSGSAVTSIATGSTGNKTFYAQWNINSYTVTFDVDGGSSVSSQSVNYNSTATRPSSAPTKTGYTFDDWYSDSSKTTKFNFSTAITTNKTIYAKWTANSYTVVFNNNNGSGSMSSLSMTYGVAKNLTANTFTRTGYTFDGWAKSASGAKQYNDGQSVSNLTSTAGGTVTLYAKWTANSYTVVYDNNGGTGSMSNQSMNYGSTYQLQSNSFTRTGYAFSGWNTNANGTGTSYSNSQSISNLTTVAGGIVRLYAQWQTNCTVGDVVYSDGTCSSAANYNNTKTPIGIVFSVSAEKVKIVHLSEQTSGSWCSVEADGYSCNPATSTSDGSGNWQIICNTVSDENVAERYPAFEYVNDLTEGGGGWYLPAIDELEQIYANKNTMNSTFTTLMNKGVSVKPLGIGQIYYLSSSSYDNTHAWGWGGSSSDYDLKNDGGNSVRAVRAF